MACIYMNMFMSYLLINLVFVFLILGGTASYLLGMSPLVAGQGDSGNTPVNIKKLSIGWMMGFLFVVSFVGLVSLLCPSERLFLYFI